MLAVDTIGHELRELTEFYPDRKDTSVSGGENERALVRQALKEQVLTLRRIDIAVAAGRLTDAAADFEAYRERMVIAVPTLMNNAEQWSLFTQECARRALRRAASNDARAARGPIAPKYSKSALPRQRCGVSAEIRPRAWSACRIYVSNLPARELDHE